MFCTLLNQHSQISLLYEADLPSLQLYLWGSLHRGGWRERWEFWNQGPSRHGIASESMPAYVSSAWQATGIAYQDVARRKHATIWGEKTHWCDHALRLADNFPDARFIFLWRDSQGVMESVALAAITEHFFRKSGFAERVLLGNEKLRHSCDELKLQGRAVHEVCYEDLVENTAECMQEICQFLEIPFEPQMTSLEGADRSAIERGQCQHHAMVRSDRIVAQRRHQELLSPALRLKIDRYICRWKRSYGGKWPKYPAELHDDTQPPDLLELWCDRVTYRSLLCWDELVKLIYALVPIALAISLRSWFRQRSDATDYSPVTTNHSANHAIPGKASEALKILS